MARVAAALCLASVCARGEDILQQATGGCKPVTTQANFDMEAFVAGRWYIQQQAVTKYLPASQNNCVYAEYQVLPKKSFWGYTIQVHNHAEEANGKVFDSGKYICAKSADPTDPAKLEVAPCFLPALTAGPYWVLAYNEEEGYALVSGGQPDIETPQGCRTGTGTNDSGLWIFTRSQARVEATVQKARDIATQQGFDLSVLNDVNQASCASAESVVVV